MPRGSVDLCHCDLEQKIKNVGEYVLMFICLFFFFFFFALKRSIIGT